MPQGTLFTEDFLSEGIAGTDTWREVPPETMAALRKNLESIFGAVANPARLNEPQTEERVIQPVLHALGWEGCYSVQERAEVKGRANVPDYLLFGSPSAFAQADRKATSAQRYPFAVAVADAKAWGVGLDRRGAGAAGDETPSGQIIRYLSRADVQSDGNVRWGVLTNGRHWRLYFQGAKSRLEEYFEIDLAWILGLEGTQGDLQAPPQPSHFGGQEEWSAHLLKVMWLMFRRESFAAGADGRTFHQLALDEGRNWESRVRESLVDVVFGQVFPDLLRALARADAKQRPARLDRIYLGKVREAALTLFYRLLFALYAEDRDLLPKRDPRYGGLSRLRDEIAERIDAGTVLSRKRKTFAHDCAELFRTIDEGDEDIGVPPYNGGLFSDQTDGTALLDRAPLPDADFAPLLDRLARTEKDGRRVRINFRDLSVRQLGSIYERLLEYEPIEDKDAPDRIAIRLNPFARKGSGSYYTPDELVTLIIERTVGPLVREKLDAFRQSAATLAHDRRSKDARLAELREIDPAEQILKLRIVDPAMGSGHFLVALVDYLAEQITTAIGEAQEAVTWADYVSPLMGRLAAIWAKIRSEADSHHWSIRDEQLADKNLLKRFVLKRCIYGVDKNPMAVELAKVSLWLHTFTAGAPLSFLDHHLKCGDSLYGEWVRKALDEIAARGTLLISDEVRKAEGAIAGMEAVEALSDAEIAEVKASATAFHDVESRTLPLKRFLDFWHAVKWLDLSDEEAKALGAAMDAAFGHPLAVLAGLQQPARPTGLSEEALRLFDEGGQVQLAMNGLGGAGTARDFRLIGNVIKRTHALAAEQHFLHWQIAFPGVWKNWMSTEPEGGFDAVIGNPPWDRMKMQEVEWFAARAPEVALQERSADRKALIAKMKAAGHALIPQYERASALAEKAMGLARRGGEYPLLSRGDINIYSLFVERAQSLIKQDGLAGLLVPSGILSDAGSEGFMKSIIQGQRFVLGIDFFNRRSDGTLFFPDVYYRFKFCVFVASGEARKQEHGEAAFFVRDTSLIPHLDLIQISESKLQKINPGRFLLPIIKDSRDIDAVTKIFQSENAAPMRDASVRYVYMFHMAADSSKFITITQMDAEGGYPVDASSWKWQEKSLVRLFEGKMIQAFDHRAASLSFYKTNIFRTGEGEATTEDEHADPSFLVTPRFYVELHDEWQSRRAWALAIKDITSTTNTRSTICGLIPKAGAGHTLPILFEERDDPISHLLCANLNSFSLDFVARTKIQGNHLTLNILNDLPVIKRQAYSRSFGKRTAADIVKDHTLRLTYTAHDMAAFARDMGYVNKDGTVKPPFIWDEEERRQLRARLDALYFILYGIADEDDIRYILSTFPIVERKDREAFDGVYLTRELILWYKRTLDAGDPDAVAPVAELIRLAKAREN
jgi:hypothetical protein